MCVYFITYCTMWVPTVILHFDIAVPGNVDMANTRRGRVNRVYILHILAPRRCGYKGKSVNLESYFHWWCAVNDVCFKQGPFSVSCPGKLRLCSANHREGYFSNLACDWLSIVWAYSKQETENGPMIHYGLMWYSVLSMLLPLIIIMMHVYLHALRT